MTPAARAECRHDGASLNGLCLGCTAAALARLTAEVATAKHEGALEEAAKHADCCVDREELARVTGERDRWKYHAALRPVGMRCRESECDAEIARAGDVEAENAALRSALEDVGNWFGLLKSPLDQWEDLAAEFHRETGYLRPGKDDRRGDHSDEERQSAWTRWADARKRAMTDSIIAALAGRK